MTTKEVKLQIDPELWHRAKVAAAQIQVTLKQLCTEAIAKEVRGIEKDYKKGS